MLSVDNINDNLWLLDPEAYSFHIKPEKGEDMTRLVSANAILLPLLSLLQLHHMMASTIEDVPGIGLLWISANIPPIQWKTVELGMFQQQLKEYVHIHHDVVSKLSIGYDHNSGTGCINMTQHWRLVHTSLNPHFEVFYRTVLNAKDALERWYSLNGDSGASFYF